MSSLFSNCAVLGLLLAMLLVGACVAPGPQLNDEGVEDPAQDLVEHIKDHPKDLQAHADLLRIQMKRADIEGARITVEHALKAAGDNHLSHVLAAQFFRWQADLLNAERELILARDLAPARLEPRVALASLYHQSYLEDEELEQRRIVLELAEKKYRIEFLLDYAYANAQAGRVKLATKTARAVLSAEDVSRPTMARAQILLCELALRESDEPAAVRAMVEARKLNPEDLGALQYAARLVTAVVDGRALAAGFDHALETQDRSEVRWSALFGKWMLAAKEAWRKGESPTAGDADALYERLSRVDGAHPDVLARRYQLLQLSPAREDEKKKTGEVLKEMRFGLPALPPTLSDLIALWRAEDSLRLGAPRLCLAALKQVAQSAPGLEGSRLLRVMALFKDRQDKACLREVESWLKEQEKKDGILQSLRWWIMLRAGRAREIVYEFEKQEEKMTNAELWIEAVAKFQTYRKVKPG